MTATMAVAVALLALIALRDIRHDPDAESADSPWDTTAAGSEAARAIRPDATPVPEA